VIGGDTITEELTIPGFRHDSCSSAHALFQASPTIRNNELELDRYGLSYLRPDPVVTMPFEDDSSLTQWLDIDRTVEEFARFSRRDGDMFRRMMAEYDSVKKIFGQQTYTPIGYGPDLDQTLRERPDGAFWLRRYRQSALEVINDYFEDDHCRTFMLWLAFMTIQPVDRPYTGRLAYAIANGRQNIPGRPAGSGRCPEH
jgi:phytoene dehydrogenase-like protein